MNFIWNIILLSVAIYVVARIFPTIHLKSFWTAIWVALVYSVINLLIGWLLVAISLPLIYITFGLFKFVINAFMLWITDKIIEDFKIEGIGTLLIAAFLISLIDSILRWIVF
ncbi:MAG: hypothetical protein Kow0042_13010 [Calditrichia bacterium]